MRATGIRILGVAALALAVVVGAAAPAGAHPLGNFTTNRYTRIEVGAHLVRLHYVLDEAELVAFRSEEERAADVDGFTARRIEAIRSGLRLELDGDAVALTPVQHRLTTPAGQGGLSTLRLEVVFEALVPGRGDEVTAEFTDANEPDRIGWREILVRGVDGAKVRTSTAPTTDRSDALRDYPTDPSVSPLDVRHASFRFAPGSGSDSITSLDGARESGIGGDRFVRLLDSTTSSPIAIAGALLVALLFGAVHALGPGHGKTVMAAYLVSTSGRKRDAVALGAVVSAMHTVSVFTLALVLAEVASDVRADRLYPALTLVAGLLVVGVGLQLLRRRVRSRRAAGVVPSPDHVHDHVDARVLVGAAAVVGDEHDHDHDHASRHGRHDAHDHAHDHGGRSHTHDLPDGVRPLSRAGLLALGTSGGLFPSPSAVVVLVGSFALGRAALGLALIAAFSIGLAAVLVGVGLLLVAGRERVLASRFAVSLPWLPIVGAGAITALGLVLVVQGITRLS